MARKTMKNQTGFQTKTHLNSCAYFQSLLTCSIYAVPSFLDLSVEDSNHLGGLEL